MLKKTLTIASVLLASVLMSNAAVDRINTLEAQSINACGPQMQLLSYEGTVFEVIDPFSCVLRTTTSYVVLEFVDRYPTVEGMIIGANGFSQGYTKYAGYNVRRLLVTDVK